MNCRMTMLVVGLWLIMGLGRAPAQEPVRRDDEPDVAAIAAQRNDAVRQLRGGDGRRSAALRPRGSRKRRSRGISHLAAKEGMMLTVSGPVR